MQKKRPRKGESVANFFPSVNLRENAFKFAKQFDEQAAEKKSGFRELFNFPNNRRLEKVKQQKKWKREKGKGDESEFVCDFQTEFEVDEQNFDVEIVQRKGKWERGEVLQSEDEARKGEFQEEERGEESFRDSISVEKHPRNEQLAEEKESELLIHSF